MARTMNVAMSVGLALAAILGAYLFVLWYASAGVIEQHEDRIAGLEKWRAEQFGGPGEVAELSDDTDEFPALPATEPMAVVNPTPAVQARRDAAWDAQRPSPVPRGKSAEWVEDAIKGFNFTGRGR
jgi:hypothetical protein